MESNKSDEGTTTTTPTPMDVDGDGQDEVIAATTGATAAASAFAPPLDDDPASNKKDDGDGDGEANDKDDDDDDDDDTLEDDDSIDDDIEDGLNDGDDDDVSPKDGKEDPEILLIKAQTLKEEGNEYFTKEKDYEKASRSYRRGVNAIKGLNKANSGDDQVKALLLSLQTNLSMMSFKLQKYKQSETVATNALAIDPKHVKSLYRRAAARRKLGDPEGARDDLKLALQEEPNNTTVRKELAALKKELEDAKRAQKESLQKAFSRGGGLLYDDKLEEEKKRAALEKEKKKEEEEALKKRKVEWEDECVKRMAKGEEAISFEDWDKERLERIKEEQKEADRKRKEEEKRRKEERKKAREATKQAKEDDDDSDVELTEQELAQMRGYKKTADGRITSYFTREQSDGVKNLIGDIAPKPIGIGSSAASSSGTIPQPITPSSSGEQVSGGKGRSSAWNHAGTWEEKDASEWCREQLQKRLKETKAEGPGSIAGRVTKVEDLTGDASVAIVSGKKRYIFDFHCKVKFEIKDLDGDIVIASGKLKLPDICSTHHEELEVDFDGWKKSPSSTHEQATNDCRMGLLSEIRESVKLWVEDFNNHY